MSEPTVQRAVLNKIALDVHHTALDKGFWDPPNPFFSEVNTKLLLIVSEVSEAMETMRKSYDDTPVHPYTMMTTAQGSDFLEEIADIIIRAFDLAQFFESAVTNIGDTIIGKMDRNTQRPRMHGKRF